MNKENNTELLFKEISYKLRGCFFKMYNELGSGYKEQIYQEALAVEMEENNLKFLKEKEIPVYYKGKKVGKYRPDFIIEGKIIVEIKAVEKMNLEYEKQLINYLKGSEFKLGFLVNFGGKSIDIRRRISQNTNDLCRHVNQ
jgi:GxxExxY protein